MTRFLSTPSAISTPTNIRLAQVPILEKTVETIAKPTIKAVVKPVVTRLGASTIKSFVRPGARFLPTALSGVFTKQFVMSELAPHLARVAAPKLANPRLMLSFIGGIHIGELTIEQIVGQSLAAVAASAVAEELARRTTKVNPVAQFSDAVVGTNWGDRAILENRKKIYRELLPKYMAEHDKLKPNKESTIPQATIQKTISTKNRPYKNVQRVTELPIIKIHKPVPTVSKLPDLNSIVPKLFGAKKAKNNSKEVMDLVQKTRKIKKAEEKQDEVHRVAARTVIYIEGNDINAPYKLIGNSTYIKIDPKHPQNTKNLVINRLVHKASIYGGLISYTGHDAIHLISGFGIDPISAVRIPAPFPMSGIDAQTTGLNTPEEKRRCLNGILQENITDGLYHAMLEMDVLKNIELLLPKSLQPYALNILEDLKKRTRLNTPQDGIKSGTDYARQASELADADLGLFIDPILLKKTTGSYTPDAENTSFHLKNFSDLLEKDSGLRAELRNNMLQYLTLTAQAEYNKAHGLAAPVQRLELTVSSQTTYKLIKTALLGLKKLCKRYPRSPAIPELINFYENLINGNENSTPTVVFKHIQNIKNT